MSRLIYNARLYLPDDVLDPGWLLMDGERIAALGLGSPPSADEHLDAQGQHLLPGFIDLHTHGARSYDVMDASPSAITELARHAARHGVTSFLPTTLTDTHERILAALRAIQAVQADPPADGARILGARLEGPYLNAEKCGAQNPQYIRRPSRAEVEALLNLEIIRLLDIAPEYSADHWLIEACVQRGIRVSLAHSSASYAQAQQAFRLGITQSTHTFNAQTGLHHREPGIVGAVLSTPDIYAELIPDGIHVHPAAMQVLWLCKQPASLLLITDAMRAAGMPDGHYDFDDRAVSVQGGEVRLPDGTLAGSTLTMDAALRNFLAVTGESLESAWQVSSWNAARALGMDAETGSLALGKLADLVLLDASLQVQMTLVAGRVVYQT